MWTYVDNIETLTSNASQAVESLAALTQFCDALHLEVDAQKTYAWSNSPGGRKHLREVEIQCKLYARDLGGHINYSRLATNQTVQAKIAKLKPFWVRLARSQAPVKQKEYALQSAAWSNLFFGIATVQLGDAHFVKLRTLATRGLGTAKHGANPMLQLSCVSPTKCDPEFYCVFHTVMSFRQFHTPEMSYAVMNALANGDKTSPGPCNSLLHALHKVGWSWCVDGICQDEHGAPFHIQDSPIQDLADRLHQAWQHRIFSLVMQLRPTMQGLSNADGRLTRASYLSLPDEQAGAIRCLLNGTQFTNDALVHSGLVDSDKCRYCQEPDSAIHRHWYCPAFASIRSPFGLDSLRDTADPCLLAHGWLPKAPALHQLQTSLAGLPDRSDNHNLPPDWRAPPEGVYVFTDGGCLHPAEPDQRVATWGFVIWTPQGFWEVARGPVPGRRQTVIRGELWAVFSALKLLAKLRVPGRLWIDNQTVYRRLVGWLTNPQAPLPAQNDSDLWTLVWLQFNQIPHLIHGFHKVHAHGVQTDQEHYVDEWAVHGNTAADKAATEARKDIPQIVWQPWQAVCQHQEATRLLGRKLHTMYAHIGAMAMQTEEREETPQPDGIPAQPGAFHHPPDPHFELLATQQVTSLPSHYQSEDATSILAWIQTLCDPTVPPTWVSFHQLLIDYQAFSQRLGPRFLEKQWRPAGFQPNPEYSHKTHTVWLSQYLTNMCKHMEMPLDMQQRRPSSHVIAFWTGCIHVRITVERLHWIDKHFRRFMRNTVARQIGRDLCDMQPGFVT